MNLSNISDNVISSTASSRCIRNLVGSFVAFTPYVRDPILTIRGNVVIVS